MWCEGSIAMDSHEEVNMPMVGRRGSTKIEIKCRHDMSGCLRQRALRHGVVSQLHSVRNVESNL